MKVTETDIAIIGAGPAGLSAAIAAAQSGARVVVVDEYSKPGGQYFRQPQARFNRINESFLGKSYQASKPVLQAVTTNDRITVRPNTLVWGAFDEGLLELECDNQCERLVSKKIIVATGAYERPIPFSGWTLPGVTTAGAAQTMLKAQFVLPGKRILMSGTGPFQLPVATQLVQAGGEVVEILETLSARDFFRPFPKPWLHIDKLLEARTYFTTLLRHRVPLRYGQRVIEARGEGRLEEVVIAPVDEHGRPLRQNTRTVAVDSLLTNFGFIPSLQLVRLLGCETKWDDAGACWVAASDADQRSNLPNVLLAGEVTGVAGHKVAMAEGTIAGLTAAVDLGLISEAKHAELSAEARGRRARYQAFADYLKVNFKPAASLYDDIAGETIVCRCEEVTADQIIQVSTEWKGSLRAIKQCTRAGMGQCQGRICEHTVARIAARISGDTLEKTGRDTPRPQIKPVSLEALSESIPEKVDR
ncbi:NAD(P)/FAD-dependent oxidoreductase [Paraburkholderia aspalathi]|uniref:NAD(P)/FAD-dependent oxidoreductase n=1 Tax=Paraburkholderia aspalathi TaxID=1324617 RepID=UPI001B0EFD45|nr:NAD(P)/FAD-dependent oxidoreductase [Paraburkholderia aspalathi]CAE6737927.1 Hydrogen cyanide synthase subunit HcnB [Paraburkholderia aspalathi]